MNEGDRESSVHDFQIGGLKIARSPAQKAALIVPDPFKHLLDRLALTGIIN